MDIKGHKRSETGSIDLQSFSNAPPNWRACLRKKNVLAPPFLGFRDKKRLKLDYNGHKRSERGSFDLQSFANAQPNWRACFKKNIFLAPPFLGVGRGQKALFF